MQPVLILIAAAISAAFLLPPPVAARSLDSLQQDVFDKEKYFVIRGETAPNWKPSDGKRPDAVAEGEDAI